MVINMMEIYIFIYLGVVIFFFLSFVKIRLILHTKYVICTPKTCMPMYILINSAEIQFNIFGESSEKEET